VANTKGNTVPLPLSVESTYARELVNPNASVDWFVSAEFIVIALSPNILL
jgi:hypothetical protein